MVRSTNCYIGVDGMKMKEKREAGEILGRGGISQRIIIIAQNIADGTYKNAIEQAGRIHELVEAARHDEYWDEKAHIGIYLEWGRLENLNKGIVGKDELICKI